LNDEAVATLRSEMLRAADEDVEENNLGRPALNKLRLLPKVVDLMQKCVAFPSFSPFLALVSRPLSVTAS